MNDAFAQLSEWDRSYSVERTRSERRAWIVAAAAIVCASCCALALVALLPLKSAIPYLVEVDRLTGDEKLLPVVTTREISRSDLLDRHWVLQYVRARERFDWNLIQADYDAVIRFSDEAVARQYAAQFQGADALDKRLGPTIERIVDIVSVTFPPGEAGRAVVRFDRVQRRADRAGPDSTARFIANLAFRYAPPVLAPERDLVENPLGFRVTSYVVDRELVDRGDSPPRVPE